MFILLFIIAVLSVIAGNFEKRATGRLTIAGIVFRTFMLGAWLYVFIALAIYNGFQLVFSPKLDFTDEIEDIKTLMAVIEEEIEGE